MKELRGKLRQKQKGGPYYYRLTVDGLRKEFALKTCVEDEAIQRAAELDAIYEAPTNEVAIAQISAIRGFSKSGTEGAIYACKVALYCPKCEKGVRVKTVVKEDGKKVRVCAKCGKEF